MFLRVKFLVKVTHKDIEMATRLDYFYQVDRLVSLILSQIQGRDKIPFMFLIDYKRNMGIPDEAWKSILNKVKRILENNYGIIVDGEYIIKTGEMNFKAVLERMINTFIGMGNCYVHFFQSVYDTHKEDFQKLFNIMKKVGILINEEDGRIYIGMGDYDTERMRSVNLTKQEMDVIKRMASVVNSIGMKKIMDYEFWELLDERNLTRVFYGDEEKLRLKFVAVPKFVEIPVKIKKKDFKDLLRREVGLIFNFDGDFDSFMEMLISRSRLIRETKLSDDASSFFYALLEDLSQGWVNIIKPKQKTEGYFVILDENNKELLVPTNIIEQTMNRAAKRFLYKRNRSRLMAELYSQGILKATSSLVKKVGRKSIRVWVFNAEYPEIADVIELRKKKEKMTDELMNLEVE